MIDRDAVGLDLAFADADGGVDHRQHERLHAVAEAGQILHLHLVEAVGHRGGVGPRREQLLVLPLHVLEQVLVVPQRVVGVEGDGEWLVIVPAHACDPTAAE